MTHRSMPVPPDPQDLQATVPKTRVAPAAGDLAETVPTAVGARPTAITEADMDETVPTAPPRVQRSADTQDFAATVPVAGWDDAGTRLAAEPAPGSAPSSDGTLPANLNLNDATLPASRSGDDTVVDTVQAAAAAAARAEEMRTLAPVTGADAPTLQGQTPPLTGRESAAGSGSRGGATGSFSQTDATGRHSGTFTRGGTRLGRTRINGRLLPTEQQLDERLQLSRTSVLTDMALVKGVEAVPKGLVRLVEQQGTDARYHINRPLAAGGMGAVLDIQDNDFRRTAAMKVIHGRFADDPQALERFLAEAQVTAQLEHPNIVPIHDMGVMPDGSLYFTMKLIEGLSLGDLVKLRRLHAGLTTREQYLADKEKKEAQKPAEQRKTTDQLAEDYAAECARGAELAVRFTTGETLLIFLKVLDGVGFAHSRGVVHRDIKPDNIMLGAHGEVLVVDWGIAKVLKKADRASEFVQRIEREVVSLRDDDAQSATMTGSAMGTLFYMPPEQARGELDRIDGRSDVYALGATLYELLSLKRCLEARSMAEALAAITTGDWIPLDRAAPDLDADLVAVVHRAMALDPERRYATCAAFADDIRRYLAGRAVLARRRNLLERLGAWYSAHRRQVQVGAAGMLLVAGAVGGTLRWVAAQKEAIGEQKVAEASQRFLALREGSDVDALIGVRAVVDSAGEFLGPEHPRVVELRTNLDNAITAAKDRVAEERKRQENRILADRQFQEAQRLEAEGSFATAEPAIALAVRLDPTNADFLKLRDRIREALADQRVQEQRTRANQLRADGGAKLAQVERLPPADPRIPALLADIDVIVKEVQAIPGQAVDPEQIKRLEQRRLAADAARQQASAAARAKPLKAEARRLLAAGEFVAARTSLDQARGLTPADPELDPLLGELVQTAERDEAEKRAVEARRNADQALEIAGGALAADNFAQALSRVELALKYLPNDPRAAEMRAAIETRRTAFERKARYDRAAAEADGALARADAARALIAGETAKEADATAAGERLARELGRLPAAKQGPLFAAFAERNRARTVIAEQWSIAEGEANSALAGLAEFPAEPKTIQVRKRLCELYVLRLRDARAARDAAAIGAYANLLRRTDPDGSFARELSNQGTLTVTGAAVQVRRLAAGADSRLAPTGPALTTVPGQALTLDAGSYELRAGDRVLSVVVAGARPLGITWPATLTQIAGFPLTYVPPSATGRVFLLGKTEVTVGQYCRFLNAPESLAAISAALRRANEGAGQRLPFIPMTSDPATGREVPLYVKVGSDPADPFLIKRIVPVDAEDLPIGKLPRADAEAFCAWLSRSTGRTVRLPKAAEWRFAADGGDPERVYPWGPLFVGAFAASSLSTGPETKAKPVGSFPADAGPFGNLDLAGNQREWLGDTEADGPLVAGASGGLIAGGSYSSDNPILFQTTYVESVEPEAAYAPIGFRILVEFP